MTGVEPSATSFFSEGSLKLQRAFIKTYYAAGINDQEAVTDASRQPGCHRIVAPLKPSDFYMVPGVVAAKGEHQTSLIPTDAPAGRNAIGLEQLTVEAKQSGVVSVLKPNRISSLSDQVSAALDQLETQKKDAHLEKWFGLPKQKLTPEVLRELKALQLRGAADPKRFFKSGDSKKIPTHFHFATVVGKGFGECGVGEHSKVFGRSSRKPKSLVSQLLGDPVVRDFTRRKTAELQERFTSGGKAWYRAQHKKKRNATK